MLALNWGASRFLLSYDLIKNVLFRRTSKFVSEYFWVLVLIKWKPQPLRCHIDSRIPYSLQYAVCMYVSYHAFGGILFSILFVFRARTYFSRRIFRITSTTSMSSLNRIELRNFFFLLSANWLHTRNAKQHHGQIHSEWSSSNEQYAYFLFIVAAAAGNRGGERLHYFLCAEIDTDWSPAPYNTCFNRWYGTRQQSIHHTIAKTSHNDWGENWYLT